jgi:very-short-patch-repair endonuclease
MTTTSMQPLWLSHYAKDLRKKMTDAEHRLWYYLRSNRLKGIKLRRQVPIHHYIADFICLSVHLVIELDGSHHKNSQQKKYDEEQTLYLNSPGYKVLRIDDNEIFQNMPGVLESILKTIEKIHVE